MSIVLDEDGRVTDRELNTLGFEIQTQVSNLFNKKTEWTVEQRVVAAFHLQSYISAEIMRRLMGNIIKRQQAAQHPTLTPEPKD